MTHASLSEKEVRRIREAVRGLRIHAMAYVAVIGALFLIDLFTGRGWWVFWPAFGWGIGLAIHAFTVFGSDFGSQWEDRMVETIIRRRQARGAASEPVDVDAGDVYPEPHRASGPASPFAQATPAAAPVPPKPRPVYPAPQPAAFTPRAKTTPPASDAASTAAPAASATAAAAAAEAASAASVPEAGGAAVATPEPAPAAAAPSVIVTPPPQESDIQLPPPPRDAGLPPSPG